MSMKLKDIFDHLTSGEFSQLSIGGEAAGVINTNNQIRVAGHIQLGLTALYRRFNLKERRLSFAIRNDADNYQLEVDDLLRVERVLTDSDYELNLNDHGDAYGCFTPTLNSLRLAPAMVLQGPDTPEPLRTVNLTVVYRANHPKIVASDGMLDATTKTVELPPSHLDALLFYVASRVNSHIGANGESTSGSVWLARYEAECKRLEHDGFVVQAAEYDTRFSDRGWV